jgi:DNA-binding NtrC family response regulator
VSVNCPQYQEGNVTVSELFGHVKGSFTGALADHPGAFEQAHGGVIFLDEVGDLHASAQAMLLRALSTGEYRPLGSTRTKSARPRVVSATNRPLNQLAMSNDFRYDLLFRLRHFHLPLPPLRERGDDWRLIVDYCLSRMKEQYGVAKRFSPRAIDFLTGYDWPGNVRQVVGVVSTAYAMSDGEVIEITDFESLIERPAEPDADSVAGRFERVVRGRENFWEIVCQAFLDRDLNRAQMKAIIKKGLSMSEGSYRRLLEVLHLPAADYQRFMDFLRHHDLKP